MFWWVSQSFWAFGAVWAPPPPPTTPPRHTYTHPPWTACLHQAFSLVHAHVCISLLLHYTFKYLIHPPPPHRLFIMCRMLSNTSIAMYLTVKIYFLLILSNILDSTSSIKQRQIIYIPSDVIRNLRIESMKIFYLGSSK